MVGKLFPSVLQKIQEHRSYPQKADAFKPSKMAKLFTPMEGKSKAKNYPVAKTVCFKAIIQGFLLDSL